MMRMMSKDEKKRFFAAAVEKVRAAAGALSEAEIQAFSDLDGEEPRAFRDAWLTFSDHSRIYLFARLNDAFERDDLYDFSTVIRAGLDDPEDAVRLHALRLIPTDAAGGFLQPLIALIRDRHEGVRVEAIRLLGRYIGERAATRPAQPRVQEAVSALESIRDEARGRTAWALTEALTLAESPNADAMISRAIHESDPQGVAAALRAVRYSLDDRWAENVLLLLDESDPEILAEAIGAAGALRLTAAREPLMKLLLNFEKYDSFILSELILALANIGGTTAKKILSFLEDASAEDSGLTGVLEEARDLSELADFERSIRADAAAEDDDAVEAEEWVSDEDYLDQLAVKLDLYLERNGLIGDPDADDSFSAYPGARFDSDSDERGDPDDDEREDGETEPGFREVGAVRKKKRTFMDWTDEEVAAFRAEHSGADFDWEAFLRENGDAE